MQKLAKQFAISDIHGCTRTLEKLVLDKISLRKHDMLYLLGDYINKGPDSKGVIDFIFKLRDSGYQVKCLRGNHEQYLLDGFIYSWEEIAFSSRGGKETLESFSAKTIQEIPSKYLVFIKSLPFYFELENHLLIHAGLNFDLADPYRDDYSMLNIRNMDFELERTGGKRIIHGHVPKSFLEISQKLEKKWNHISIDAGCVYNHLDGLNHLVALDIETEKLYIQKNIDS